MKKKGGRGQHRAFYAMGFPLLQDLEGRQAGIWLTVVVGEFVIQEVLNFARSIQPAQYGQVFTG